MVRNFYSVYTCIIYFFSRVSPHFIKVKMLRSGSRFKRHFWIATFNYFFVLKWGGHWTVCIHTRIAYLFLYWWAKVRRTRSTLCTFISFCAAVAFIMMSWGATIGAHKVVLFLSTVEAIGNQWSRRTLLGFSCRFRLLRGSSGSRRSRRSSRLRGFRINSLIGWLYLIIWSLWINNSQKETKK